MDYTFEDVRTQVEVHIETGQWNSALAALRQMWRNQPTPAVAAFVTACKSKLLRATAENRAAVPLIACRLALLRSCTMEPATPLLNAGAFLSGIDLTVELSPFNAYAQQILDRDSELYAFRPDVILLAVQTCDIAPELWGEQEGPSGSDYRATIDQVVTSFRGWVETLRRNTNAAVIVHNLEQPAVPLDGLLDAQAMDGQTAAIQAINQELRRMAGSFTNVYVLDYDGLVARHGRERWHDEKKWMSIRLPLRAESLPLLAAEWLRFLHPLTGRIGKVLVTDLDNTLWGGVVGEDGVTGIHIGREYHGAPFLALQHAIHDQYRKGVLLAMASKNNPADVDQVFEQRAEMLLRAHHFAARRVNWNDKATSLQEIAGELNVGLDSLVFLDDNPVERDRVRRELPAVTVIELPDDPSGYARALRDCPMFERLETSVEDRQRTTYYAEQGQRRELQQRASSIEDFYYSLQQAVDIRRLAPDTLIRAAQLTQKTNQFNLTTHRYTEAEVMEMAQRPGWAIFTLGVRDRFGDNGITGLCVTRESDRTCHIDTLLLSCRVIGRTVETALLAFLVEHCRRSGIERMEGWFVPSSKNGPASAFYSSHGFREEHRDGAAVLWSLALDQAAITCPAWITLNADEEINPRAYANH